MMARSNIFFVNGHLCVFCASNGGLHEHPLHSKSDVVIHACLDYLNYKDFFTHGIHTSYTVLV